MATRDPRDARNNAAPGQVMGPAGAPVSPEFAAKWGPQSPFSMGGLPAVGGPMMRSPMQPAGPSDMAGPSGGKGFLPAIGDALKEYGPLALAGLSVWEGMQQGNKQDEMVKRAVEEENAKKAMIAAGRERRQSLPEAEPTDLFNDPGNPYRKRLPSVGGR